MTPGERDILLVVDVQNDFIPGGALAVAGGHEVVPTINRLARAFRASCWTPVPIIETVSGTSLRCVRASNSTSGPFSALSRPTQPTAKSARGIASAPRAASRSSAGEIRRHALGNV